MPLEQSTAAEVVEPKKQIYGKIFTVEWLLNSLKKNDKIYQQLHSDKIVKDVSIYLFLIQKQASIKQQNLNKF